MAIDLNNMSVAELQDLRKRIDREIETSRDREREQVRKDLQQMARDKGYSLEDLFTKSAKKSKAPPKYRNPEAPDQTWSGRGRRPKWIEQSGRDLDDFLIDKG